MTIADMRTGSGAKILSVGGQRESRMHILGMGLIPGATVKVVKRAPMGDPIELQIRGFALSLRLADARSVEVEPLPDEDPAQPEGAGTSSGKCGKQAARSGKSDRAYTTYLHDHNAHPGLGDGVK